MIGSFTKMLVTLAYIAVPLTVRLPVIVVLPVSVASPALMDPVVLIVLLPNAARYDATLLLAYVLPNDQALPFAYSKLFVNRLPAVTLALTLKLDRVPTDVIFGCAAVYTVPDTRALPT